MILAARKHCDNRNLLAVLCPEPALEQFALERDSDAAGFSQPRGIEREPI